MKIILALALALSMNVYAQPAQDPATAPADKAPNLEKVEPPNEKSVGAVKHPKVFFVFPKNGMTVAPKFHVRMGVEGMKVKPAATMDVGTGHHHLIVDGAAIPKGQVVPKDEKNLHYGKAEIQTELSLSPGEHTLTLQFADGNHLSYGPDMSSTIKVKVK